MQKNRGRGKQARSNNKDHKQQQRGSKKASSKGNTKNKKNNNNASKISKTVVAPEMSATNFPSLLSSPAVENSSSTSADSSPTTSPTVTKASGWASVLKKSGNVVKPKKRNVSPKSESTSSSKTNSKKSKASGNNKKKSNPKTVVESKDKNVVSSPKSSEKPKNRPRRGWEKTDQLKQLKLKQAKEAARRAHEEALKRKVAEDKESNTATTTDHKVSLISKTNWKICPRQRRQKSSLY